MMKKAPPKRVPNKAVRVHAASASGKPGKAAKAARPAVKHAARPAAKVGETVKARPAVKTPAVAPVRPMVARARDSHGAAIPVFRGEKKRYFEALQELRNEIIGQVRNLSASSLASTKQAGEELADIGSDNFTRDIGLAMMTEDGKKMQLIQEAIERLQSGTYGVCVDCSGHIAEGRLRAIPYAKLCVDCKAKREAMEKESGFDSSYAADSGDDGGETKEGGEGKEAGDDEEELVE